jgi:hypothetical protein
MNKSPIILTLMVSLIVGVGCAKSDWIQSTLVTVDVTGVWVGSTGKGIGQSVIRLELEQQGPNVKGYYRRSSAAGGSRQGPIDGTVGGDVFRFRAPTGGPEGELTVSGDE